MVSPGGKLKPGRARRRSRRDSSPRFSRSPSAARASCSSRATLPLDEAIERIGHVPLPPYIERAGCVRGRRAVSDGVRARERAPSPRRRRAALHAGAARRARRARRRARRGVLHVGAGTFKPVEVEDPAEHVMHEEWYSRLRRDGATHQRAPRARADACGRSARRGAHARERGGRRRPSFAPARARRASSSGRRTRFRAVDRIVTNFHLPRSTLIMLVAAFAGYELTMRAYREADRGALSVLLVRRRDGDRLTHRTELPRDGSSTSTLDERRRRARAPGASRRRTASSRRRRSWRSARSRR